MAGRRTVRAGAFWMAVTAALVFAWQGLGQAQDVKARMLARVPVITAQKAAGVLGENNQGFVEVRGAGGDAALAEAENADRREVYGMIAQKEGTEAGVVGRRRAARIRDMARPGEWLQDPGGRWYKK
jgi:uncharacterized protein YdbL (DUF1318 family)